MELITQYLTKNPCYQVKESISVKGLMLHSVATPQPDPLVFVKAWNHEEFDRACVHGFIGSEQAFITLPCFEQTATSGPGKAHRGWHAGGAANNTHIGIEMCEPKEIRYTGGSSFVCTDKPAAVAFVKQVTQNAAALFAALCIYHGLDPLEDGVIISHAEGHKLGIASNHSDPEHLWRGLDMDYSMDQFRADVAEHMAAQAGFNQAAFNRMMDAYLAERAEWEPSAWSAEAREWAEAQGIIQGDEEGNKHYLSFSTREELVQMLYNMSKQVEETEEEGA